MSGWPKVWCGKKSEWQNVWGGKMSVFLKCRNVWVAKCLVAECRVQNVRLQNVGESEKVVELILFYLIQTSNKSNLISKLLSNQINLNFGQIIKSSGLPTHIGGESRLVAAE